MLYFELNIVKIDIFVYGSQDGEDFVNYCGSYSFSHTRLKVFGFLI